MANIARRLTIASRWLQTLILAGLSCGLLAFVVVVIWARQVTPADPSARFALDSDDTVVVTTGDWVTFGPRDADPDTGVIFYPGGKADPVAYAPILNALAARGYLVVMCPMPLNLALLAPERAVRVISRFPEIKHWVMAGHSLGGVVAAEFAERHGDKLAGLMLWASYPAESTDLSARDLPVLSVFGTADTLATPEEIDRARGRLPPQATYLPLQGGDHWGFGSFDAGPSANSIPRDAQQAAALDATQAFLQTVAATSPTPEGY